MSTELPETMMDLTDHVTAALALAEAITVDLPDPVPPELLDAITASPESRRDAAIRSARAAGLERVEQFSAACDAVANCVEFTLLEKTLQLFKQLKRVSGIALGALADNNLSVKRAVEDQIVAAVKASAKKPPGGKPSRILKTQLVTA